jgi:hypothetical protein
MDVETMAVDYAGGEDLVDIALSEALMVVLRDLDACGAPVPDVRDQSRAHARLAARAVGRLSARVPD